MGVMCCRLSRHYVIQATCSEHQQAVAHLTVSQCHFQREMLTASYLLFSLALNLFGDFGYGVAPIALTGSHKTGEIPPVPVAEALLQQQVSLLDVLLCEGLGVSGGGGNLGLHHIIASTLQICCEL